MYPKSQEAKEKQTENAPSALGPDQLLDESCLFFLSTDDILDKNNALWQHILSLCSLELCKYRDTMRARSETKPKSIIPLASQADA